MRDRVAAGLYATRHVQFSQDIAYLKFCARFADAHDRGNLGGRFAVRDAPLTPASPPWSILRHHSQCARRALCQFDTRCTLTRMSKQAHRTVRLDEQLVREAERHARAAHRSVAAQFEYWIRLGRGVERNRSFSEDRIAQFLAGAAPLDHLSLQEKIAAIHEIERCAQTPENRAKATEELRAQRQRAGLPSYKVDDRYPGKLICSYPGGRIVVGHFEGSEFVEEQELASELSPKRRERRRRAAA